MAKMVEQGDDQTCCDWEFDTERMIATHRSGLTLKFLIPLQKGDPLDVKLQGDVPDWFFKLDQDKKNHLVSVARTGMVSALGGPDKVPEIIWFIPTF